MKKTYKIMLLIILYIILIGCTSTKQSTKYYYEGYNMKYNGSHVTLTPQKTITN